MIRFTNRFRIAYLAENKLGRPRYTLITEADGDWHCDVEVDGRVFCTGTVPSSCNQAKEMGARAVLHHLLMASGRVARTVSDDKPLIREKISFSSNELEDMRRARKTYEAKLASRDEEFVTESGPVFEESRRLPGTKANRTPLGNPRWKPAQSVDTRPAREVTARLPLRGPAESYPPVVSRPQPACRSRPASRSPSASCLSRPLAASLALYSPSRTGSRYLPSEHDRE